MSCILMLEMCMYVYVCKLSVTNVGAWHVRIQAPGAKQTLLLLELPWQLLGGPFLEAPRGQMQRQEARNKRGMVEGEWGGASEIQREIPASAL